MISCHKQVQFLVSNHKHQKNYVVGRKGESRELSAKTLSRTDKGLYLVAP